MTLIPVHAHVLLAQDEVWLGLQHIQHCDARGAGTI